MTSDEYVRVPRELLAERLYIAFWSRNGWTDQTPFDQQAEAIKNMWRGIASDALAAAPTPPDHGVGEACRADELLEVVAALYKAWPDAEDIASDWPLGIIGSIEQIIAERDEALASLAVVRQSLEEQAAARRDPTMPVLTPGLIERLSEEAEATWACAEDQEDRVYGHGLMLLVEWQKRAVSSTPETTLLQGQEPVAWQRRLNNPADEKGWSAWTACTPAQAAYAREHGGVEHFHQLQAEARPLYALTSKEEG